jgi:D-ala D-ala ligase C-terminus
MTDIFIYPYKAGSKSVALIQRKFLDEGTRVKAIRLENSTFKNGPAKTVINWGSSAANLVQIQRDGPVLNKRVAVQVCANKARFFDAVGDRASVPPNTTDKAVAQTWQGVVVGRSVLNGHSGQGICFSDETARFWEMDFPLYTQYIPKKSEFRVHIFNGEVIDVQQKKLRTADDNGQEVNRDDINFRVRSHANGFIFARNELVVPPCVTDQAVRAFNCINGLDFGAVDVLYNERRNTAYVLEINTAPGLEGQTLDSYVNAIKRIM